MYSLGSGLRESRELNRKARYVNGIEETSRRDREEAACRELTFDISIKFNESVKLVVYRVSLVFLIPFCFLCLLIALCKVTANI